MSTKNRYQVEIEVQTLKGQPDGSMSMALDADSPDAAIAVASSFARRQYRCGKVTSAVATLIAEPVPEPTVELDEEADAFSRASSAVEGALAPMPAAAQRYLDSVAEVCSVESLSDEDVSALEDMVSKLPRGAVKLGLEVVLAQHARDIAPSPVAHDFGNHGSSRYCKRPGCEVRNQPPVNRWGCKGAA